MSEISISDLLRHRLEELGADGLVNVAEECGCFVDNLAPCQGPDVEECWAARLRDDKSGTPEFLIALGQAGGKDD